MPPEQALPEPAIGVSQAAAAGAAAGAVGAAGITAAGVSTAAGPGVPLLALGLKTIDELLDAVRVFFRSWRAWQERWVAGEARRRRLPERELFDAVAEENARQAEFERRMLERVRRDLGPVLDPARGLGEAERRAAVGRVVARERVYARQRAEAMAARTLASLDRAVLRRESPSGAFWVYVRDARTTPDCLAMGGRFWPWEALAVLRPPTHPGCRCRLVGYREAVEAGLMAPGVVSDVAVAVRRAHAARALLHEEEVSLCS